MESVILSPRYVFLGFGNMKPKLVYLPKKTGMDACAEYMGLIAFLSSMYDENNQLAHRLMGAFKKIGFNLNEAAHVLVEASKRGHVDSRYEKTGNGKRVPSTIGATKKIHDSDEDNKTISLLEETDTYEK